jgi:hypothetical protein
LVKATAQGVVFTCLIIFMTLVSLIITLIVVGVLLWLVNAYIPMDGKIKQILNVVVVICVVVWLLYAFGILNHANDLKVPRLN